MNPTTELQSITQLLHLTHHRNHNQHRLSKWYSQFSQMRRQISKLLASVEALDTAISFSSSGTSKYMVAAREKVEERVEFMRVWLVPRCFLAFSNLVADNQYAVLGLMLMATLARVRSVLLLLGGKEDVDEEVVTEEVANQSEMKLEEEAGLDFGEVIERDEVENAKEALDESEVKLKTSSQKRKLADEVAREGSSVESPPTKVQKKKKKRKKGDAFDDLFDSLI